MKKWSSLLIAALLCASLLTACASATTVTPTVIATEALKATPSFPTNTPITFPASETPAVTATPASDQQYEPVDDSVCKTLQELAASALKVDVTMTSPVAFSDPLAGDSGQGCRLTASGTGVQFKTQNDAMTILKNSVANGWYELNNYEADGPTGTASGFYRDMALMIISVNWEPQAGAACPTDQPISVCDLKPEQKLFTIELDIAQLKADFSLDGKWVDDADNFTLNLSQEWKHIYGGHVVVAQSGNKIDSLEDSIDGMLKGKSVKVTFQSSFASEKGTALITYVDVNTITWKIITPPSGEYYLPQQATLKRE